MSSALPVQAAGGDILAGTSRPLVPGAACMRWVVHSEEPVYTDPWLDIRVADVELPDGRHLEHRLIRTAPGAGAVVADDQRRVLLLWRHRFITGSYGWEIPIGKIEAGEDPADSAAREVEEETGWRPGPLRPLLRVEPTPGISDSVHHLYRADQAQRVGPPEDDFESERVAWVPLNDIPAMIGRGEIASGTTLAALLYTLTSDGLCAQ
jgi:ADP-ribose diphosphatase